jgi:hypothetical protein
MSTRVMQGWRYCRFYLFELGNFLNSQFEGKGFEFEAELITIGKST